VIGRQEIGRVLENSDNESKRSDEAGDRLTGRFIIVDNGNQRVVRHRHAFRWLNQRTH
jgi:hypothetical protein